MAAGRAKFFVLEQCDQIGRFLTLFGKCLLQKDAQMYGDFCAILKNIPFQAKTDLSTFWPTFGKIWATFYFSIWSHCNLEARRRRETKRGVWKTVKSSGSSKRYPAIVWKSRIHWKEFKLVFSVKRAAKNSSFCFGSCFCCEFKRDFLISWWENHRGRRDRWGRPRCYWRWKNWTRLASDLEIELDLTEARSNCVFA